MKNLVAFPILILSILIISCESKSGKMGDQYFKNGEYDKAIVAYDEYLEYQPTDINSIYNRGRAYEELENYDEALKSYQAVLEEDPKNINALLSIGKYHYRQGNYADAAFQFEKATEINNKNAKAYFLLGRAQHNLGKIPEAMAAYDGAISINKDYGEAYLYRGALKVYQKQRKSGCNDLNLAPKTGCTRCCFCPSKILQLNYWNLLEITNSLVPFCQL